MVTLDEKFDAFSLSFEEGKQMAYDKISRFSEPALRIVSRNLGVPFGVLTRLNRTGKIEEKRYIPIICNYFYGDEHGLQD